MTAFRILNQFPVYFTSLGTLAAGGYLRFYETGTTTTKDVYSDRALAVNIGHTVTLDASGRTNTDVWGSGEYRVRLYSSADVLIDEADNVEVSGGASSTLPSMTGNSGEFLTNNGVSASWTTVIQVPDPTGHAGEYLTNDGTTASWEAQEDAGVTDRQTVTAAATTTIDLSLGKFIELEQGVNIGTLTFTNTPSEGACVVVIRRVKDNSGTARTITWPASVKWPGGVAPTLSSTANAIDMISLAYDESVFYGSFQLAYA